MLLEACQVHGKLALKHSSKSTKYELAGYYGDPLYEHFRFDVSEMSWIVYLMLLLLDALWIRS